MRKQEFLNALIINVIYSQFEWLFIVDFV